MSNNIYIGSYVVPYTRPAVFGPIGVVMEIRPHPIHQRVFQVLFGGPRSDLHSWHTLDELQPIAITPATGQITLLP